MGIEVEVVLDRVRAGQERVRCPGCGAGLALFRVPDMGTECIYCDAEIDGFRRQRPTWRSEG